MLNAGREREFIMKAKSRKRKVRGEVKLLLVLVCILVVAITTLAKGNRREVIGYVYDSGNTVWEMAERHCPGGMDILEFAIEIEKANGIEDSVVHKNWSYKIPVYEAKSEYLDMNTIVGYELSDDGVLLLANDGSGYFVAK